MNVYIPTYNSAAFLIQLDLDPRFNVIVVDNCSEDATTSIANKKGWQVIQQKQHVGRVTNWQFAMEHFLLSNCSWGKWLFTGDKLNSSCYEKLTKAIQEYPKARLIIAEYDIIAKNTSHRWNSLFDTRLIQPLEAMELVSIQGNWFGSPIGHAFHKEAVQQGFTFGNWHWVADMQFCLSLAVHSPVLYLKECIGEFHADSRKVYSKNQYALSSSIEEYLLRKNAAQEWLNLSNDKLRHEFLGNFIADDIEQTIIRRSLQRTRLKNQSILTAVPYQALLREIILRPFQ